MRDIEIINLELIMADIQMIDNILPGLQRKLKTRDPDTIKLVEIFERMKAHLEDEKLAIDMKEALSEKELELLKPYNFLTFKPFVYALNVSEDELKNSATLITEREQKLNKSVAVVSAKFETELMELDADEKEMFFDDLR